MQVFRKNKLFENGDFEILTQPNLAIHYPNPAGGPGGILTLPGAPGGFQNTHFEIPAFEIVVFPLRKLVLVKTLIFQFSDHENHLTADDNSAFYEKLGLILRYLILSQEKNFNKDIVTNRRFVNCPNFSTLSGQKMNWL